MRLSKTVTLLLAVLLIVSSLLMVELAFAQSASVPSVPEFMIKPVGPSFDIPPTYSFNSSSGLFYVNSGYHFEYSTVEIIIKNQEFTNQTNIDFLYYNVRIKPHNYPDSYWQELFSAGADGYPVQTTTNYTVIPLQVEGTQASGASISTGATTDIQVEAMIGHIGRNNTVQPYPYPYVFFGETSGWSNTQTVTLPPKIPFTFSPTPTPTPTAPPTSNTNPANSITLPLTVFAAIIAVFVLALVTLLFLLKRSHPTNT